MKKVIIGSCIVLSCALLEVSAFAFLLAIGGFIIFIQGAFEYWSKVIKEIEQNEINLKRKK